MKRITNILSVLITFLLFNATSYANDEDLSVVSIDKNLEITASDSLETTDKVVSNSIEASLETNIATDSQKIEKSKNNEAIDDKNDNVESAKKDIDEKKDNSWVETVSGKQLNNLKQNLENLQKIYNINYHASEIAKAINFVEKNDNYQKRNVDLLLDTTREAPFNIYASSYIFPELLKLNIQIFNEELLYSEKTITDEIADTPEELDKLINKISNNINNYKSIYSAYCNLVLKTKDSLNELKRTNTKTNNTTQTGYYIKRTNLSILETLEKQLDYLNEISEQLNYAIEYSKEQINFIITHNQTISIKGKYIAEIRSAFKDLEKFIEKYEYKQEYNYSLFSDKYSKRYDKIRKLIGNEEIRENRIYKQLKNQKYKKSSYIFNANDDLKSIFELLDFYEANSELYENLLNYISNECWQSRYEEPKDDSKSENKNEKEEKTNIKKQKPKLIDFEE